jgi:hypothetical protein
MQPGCCVVAPRRNPRRQGGEAQHPHHHRDAGPAEHEVQQVRGGRRDQHRQERGNREQRVQDSEDPAADTGRQLLLEGGLGGNGHEGVLDAGGDGNDDHERDERDDRRQGVRQAVLDRPEGGPQPAGDRLHQGQPDQGDPHGHQPQVDHQAAWQTLAVGVEEQDSHHGAQAGRAHHEEEVRGSQAKDVGGEAGADGAHDPDQAGGDAEVGQRPGDAPIGAHECDPLLHLVEHRAQRVGSGRPLGQRDALRPARGQRHDGRRGQAEHHRHDDVHRVRADGRQQQRPEEAEADGERRVDRQHEDRVGRHQVAAIDDARNGGQLGRCKERRHGGNQQVDEQDQRHVGADEDEQHHAHAAQQVGGEHDQPRVAALHEDARHGAEDDRGHQEGEDQHRVGRVRAGGRHDGGHQCGQHHVVGQLAQQLRGPQQDEAAVAEDAAGAREVLAADVLRQIQVRHSPRSRWAR